MPPIVCKLLGHHRSRRDARRIDDRWISYCRRCGSLMVRRGPKQWSAVHFDHGVAIDPAEESAAG
ncbi:MAG TPA: hypothetical protein VM757_06405 [Sphingomicrobium sp.]|jgi:hypothetical protein|nr:hypothetical protein [Sphingomicrobium sp.]